MRRTPALVIAVPLGAVLVASAGPAVGTTTATTAQPRAHFDRHGEVRNVLPPGAAGSIDAAQAAQFEATGALPAHFADQLPMYDGLNRVRPTQISAADLRHDFKNARLGVAAADVVSVQRPKAGVVIRRDRFGVPHVTGATATDVSYGAGYAGIEDRMFLTDVLRHYGAANLAAFLGPSASDLAMDQSQLLIAPYTRKQAEAQIGKVVKRYPTAGAQLLKRLDAFLAGMNAAQRALCPGAFGLPVSGGNGGGFGPQCPVEYAALQKAPTPYTRGDIVYIASLVGGIFGKGGGGEYGDALFYEALRHKFGRPRAVSIYDDLREKNDPEAFTSATTRFPYLVGGLDPRKASVALPVRGATVAPGTAAPAAGSAPVPLPPLSGTEAYRRWLGRVSTLHTPLGSIRLGLGHDMSNALLVEGSHTADGHPIAVFGPQVGYFTPQILDEIDLHGPGIDARGASFPGTQLVVELGHGVDYAWSATSADGDLVDTVMERLCNADGSRPTVHSTSYRRHGKCVPMRHYVHDEGVSVPTAGGTGQPEPVRFDVWLTRHGIVQFRTKARGVNGHVHPVAVVSQRSTYGHELDSALGFARINNPNYVHSAKDFMRAFAGVDYTFNWFYADSRDIAYKVSGLMPVRPPSVEPDLPRWGDARFDWRGFLPTRAHPHQVDPPRGFTASWNNKQAPGWGMADDQWGHSKVHRVNLLALRTRRLIAGGHKVTRADLVGAMMGAATTDLRGAELLPLVLRVVGDDPHARGAIRILRSWVRAGAHRVDRRRTGHYGHQAAIALFDTWWDNNGKGGGLARSTLRPLLGALAADIPQGTDDHPRQGVGSSWDSVAYYGYVSRVLRGVLGRHVRAPYANAFCGSLATCRQTLRRSLRNAIKRALAAQGASSVGRLTYDKTADDIRPTTVGVVGVSPIDWQNRPTFQQVVNFRTHRASFSAAAAAPSGGTRAALVAVSAGLLLAVAGTRALLLARRGRRPRRLSAAGARAGT